MVLTLRRLSIKLQLLVLEIISVTILLFVVLLIYVLVARMLETNNSRYSGAYFDQAGRYVSDNCGLLSAMLTNAAYNDNVQKFMKETDDDQTYVNFKNVDALFNSLQALKSAFIIDFVVLGDNGNTYFQNGRNESTLALLNSLPRQGLLNHFTGRVELIYRGVKRDCFVIASTVYALESTIIRKDAIGLAAIVVDAKLFEFTSDSGREQSESSFYLLDRNHAAYSSRAEPLTESLSLQLETLLVQDTGREEIMSGGAAYVVNYEKVPQIEGTIVSIIAKNDLLKDIIWIRRLALLIIGAALILMLIPYALILNNLLSPLNKFMHFMQDLRNGSLSGLKKRIRVTGYAEMEIMSGEFNTMLDEIDGLTNRLVGANTRLYQTELAQKRSEIAYLKSQINPHFLYNTLETMIGEAYEEGALKTARMIKALVVIFRYSVKGRDFVRLEEEYEIIQSYIFIQQTRFADKFTVAYQLAPDTLTCLIPKVILQPLVENAIFYGLETKLEPGRLMIGSQITDQGELNLWVHDDGLGMSAEQLTAIRKQLAGRDESADQDPGATGIGIVNVHDRIRLIYGDDYGLWIDSEPNRGTWVKIRLPACRPEESETVIKPA